MIALTPALTIAAALLGGALLGWIHFSSLHTVTQDYAQGRAPRAVLLQFGRLAILAGGLFLLARLGAWPLLAGSVGLFAARAAVLRKARRDP
ncbi:ATP synthase subunit I [Novosphingobium sp. ZN18A2]|uniref:N-ATPase subunit AtpR n=1 Tax=Novosphingobium sp. ZN18A2 TaxID=3079861 RepID=UPI0030D6181B